MTVRALQNVPMILSQITKVWLLLFSYFCCLRCTSNKISPLIFVHLNLGHSWRSVFYFTSLWNPSLGFLYTPNPGVSFYLLWATVPYIIHVLHLTVIYVPCISVFFCFCLGCCIYLKLLFVLPSFQDKTFFFFHFEDLVSFPYCLPVCCFTYYTLSRCWYITDWCFETSLTGLIQAKITTLIMFVCSLSSLLKAVRFIKVFLYTGWKEDKDNCTNSCPSIIWNSCWSDKSIDGYL